MLNVHGILIMVLIIASSGCNSDKRSFRNKKSFNRGGHLTYYHTKDPRVLRLTNSMPNTNTRERSYKYHKPQPTPAPCGRTAIDGPIIAWTKNTDCILKPFANKMGTKVKDFGENVITHVHEMSANIKDFNTIFVPALNNLFAPAKKKANANVFPVVTTSTERLSMIPNRVQEMPTNQHEFEKFDCPRGQVRDNLNQCRPEVWF